MPQERPLPPSRHHLLDIVLRATPTRVADELHLPSHIPKPRPNHNNDHKRSIPQDPEPPLKPSRVAPRPRLGFPPPPDDAISEHDRSGRQPPCCRNEVEPRFLTAEYKHQFALEHLHDDYWRGPLSRARYGRGEMVQGDPSRE